MPTELTSPEMIVYDGQLGHLAALGTDEVLSVYTPQCPRGSERLDEENPETPLYVRTSRDSGLTWSDPRCAFSYPPGKGVTGAALPVVAPDGTLHLFALRYYEIGGDWAPESASSSVVLHCASSDAGVTWGRIRKVDYGKSYTGALNSAIALTSGRLLVVLSSPSDRQGGRNVCVATHSDDGGETWTPSDQDISVPDGELPGHPGALEPVALELLDGRVWMLIRTQTGYYYQSHSTDQGALWSPPTRTQFRAPNAPAGICRLSDDRVALCWNDLSQYPPDAGGSQRQFLHLAVSDDDGMTFRPSREIARRGPQDLPDTNVAYPFLCETPDGRLLVLYYRVGCAPGVTWWNPLIEVLRVAPEWLAAG